MSQRSLYTAVFAPADTAGALSSAGLAACVPVAIAPTRRRIRPARGFAGQCHSKQRTGTNPGDCKNSEVCQKLMCTQRENIR